ncbi:hypothetical protein B0H17DRAFT_1133578 [Mycena rosella]|uniref:Uncharacterized protein n=1 Tax=Mycena rosella TaxID=1033263 RepID=A0AAD7DHC4_MYCRO|nr:hypothetical protein B0H17DRAFT_1133578 [Mycena rosella]
MSRLGNFHQIGWGGCWDKCRASQFGHYRSCPNWENFTKEVGEDVGTIMWLRGAVIDTAVSRAGYLATERAQRAAGLPQNYRNRTPDTSVTGDIGGDAQEYCWGGPGIFGGPHREKKQEQPGEPQL